MIRTASILALSTFAIVGCETNHASRADPAFSKTYSGQTAIPKDTPPAPIETATRVDSLGRKLLAANPELRYKPLFSAIGSSEVAIFHQGIDSIFVTDGLVRKCKTDEELQAVLAVELGRMTAEREAILDQSRLSMEGEPIPTRPPGDSAGARFEGDMTTLAENAAQQSRVPRHRPSSARPKEASDPRLLAVIYLEKAGVDGKAVRTAEPVLREAERNPRIENAFAGRIDGVQAAKKN